MTTHPAFSTRSRSIRPTRTFRHISPERRAAASRRSPGRPWRRITAFAGSLLALVATGLAVGAGSAAAVEISTDYPVVNVQAGQSVTLHLNLAAKDTERVGLALTDVPSGWTANLEGGGFTIGGVYVRPDSSPGVTLHTQVPADAQTGTYHIKIQAKAPSGNKNLTVEFHVVKQASNAFQLSAQFDKLQGSTTDSFDYSLTLANNTGEDATFGLTAKGPQGWTVTASPSSQDKASAVDVKGGESSTISVTAKPPSSVSAGTYPIVVTAKGNGSTLQQKLTVQVVGSAKLQLATANQTLNASGSAGDTTDVHLTISNTGTAPLAGVSLASSPPDGWKVTFDPKQIDQVAPGKSADVVAHITPAGNAITGDYQVTLSAKSASSDGHVDLRYSVQTSSWWGLIGVIVIAVAIVVLLWLFRRFGRR